MTAGPAGGASISLNNSKARNFGRIVPGSGKHCTGRRLRRRNHNDIDDELNDALMENLTVR